MTKQSGPLEYIGDGAAFDNIPARDLSSEEVAESSMSRAQLVASGLYREPVKKDEDPKEI